ncbi:MAG TPA: AAA family ATPase [Roseiflexaceae bacterium]|nr:AAA family ATPase [Roseiflexaceae bacterium]
MTTIPDPNDIKAPAAGGAPKRRAASKKKTASAGSAGLEVLLARCTVDLTAMAQRGELRRCHGRDEHVEQIWQLLRADSTRRPVILGKHRSGKTALAHEVARRIAAGECPPELRGLSVYETAPATLTAALQFGEGWRENLSQLLQGLADRPALIFLRDAHAAPGAGRQGDDETDLADALVSALRTGKLRWLAEARSDLWRAAASADAAFAECFAPVNVPEMSAPAARAIVEVVARERFGQAAPDGQAPYTPAALDAVLDVAGRFLLNQALPGKAVDLLEEAERYARRAGAAQLDTGHVIASFVARTGLSRLLLDDDLPFDERAVRRYFAERVLGQEPAVSAVVQAVALLKARLNDPARPMGVFLFLGPTGVGKTELAKTLCTFLFGAEERLLRFNMADFSFYWQYEELFGDPDASEPAARRGLLSRKLAGETFGVVLLDEFEKAHETIFQRFLQVFDEGILVNPAGEEINLRNMVIIMTSNFGAQLLHGETWGFAAREDLDAAERRILRESESFFTPEFINRLDAVIFFKPLSLTDMRQIAYRELRRLFEREGLVRRGIGVELDDAVVDLLLKHGYSLRFGARYLKRQIEKRISYPLARAILSARPAPPAGALADGEAGPGDGGRSAPTLRLYARGEQIDAGWVRDEEEERPAQVVAAGRSPAAGEIAAALPQLEARLAALAQRTGLGEARARMDELLAAMSEPAFWDDGRAAEAQLTELGEVSRRVDRGEELRRRADELRALVERITAHYERRLLPEAARLYQHLERDLAFAELESYFSAPEEWGDAYLVIQTAPGDARAPHWAAQLLEAYEHWAGRCGLSCAVVDEAPADEGIWRTTLLVEGSGAYGLLQSERGTHRFAEMVRGADSRRKQVSQVRVDVLPALEESRLRLGPGEVSVEARPLRERGRRLRKLRSEARAVHIASGAAAVVACDTDVSAAEAQARALLRGRLFVARAAAAAGLDADPPWGSVVRAYQLARRSLVKDPRTGVSHSDLRAVLAGGIDPFIAAYLQMRLKIES